MRYYAGRIKRVSRDGTFDIDYDDGEKETRVEENLIKLLDSDPDDRLSRTPSRKLNMLEEGDE